MKLPRILFAAVGILSFSAAAQPADTGATATADAPDQAPASGPLPEGVIAWDATLQTVDATAGQDFAHFTFRFINTTTGPVMVLKVHPSCGCTTADLPPTPWSIPAGTGGEIRLSVNLAGKAGRLFKSVAVITDRGRQDLMLQINILPAVGANRTGDQRAAGIAAAKMDRQAVFKGDCASCHLKDMEGRSGRSLYVALCGICHEAEPRAAMVPDLGKLQVPTSVEFWRAWIAEGKPGTLMPAFAAALGGPLDDGQIAALAAYLDSLHPSPAATAPAK